MHYQILNLKNGWPDADYCFYVGRSRAGKSPLGNPYQIGKDGDRREVIEKYRRWLWEEIKKGDDSPAYRELVWVADFYKCSTEQEPIKLLCWCAPQPCHAEVIIRAIEWLLKNEKTRNL